MNLGFTEMIFLAVLGLLLFGPRKLPEIGRQLGKAMGEFKRASQEFQMQLNEEVRQLDLESELKEPAAQPPGATARTRRAEEPAPARESSDDDSRPDAGSDTSSHG